MRGKCFPFFHTSAFSRSTVSALVPFWGALFLPDFLVFTSGAEAMDGMMPTLFQMSVYRLLMYALVALAAGWEPVLWAALLCGHRPGNHDVGQGRAPYLAGPPGNGGGHSDALPSQQQERAYLCGRQGTWE